MTFVLSKDVGTLSTENPAWVQAVKKNGQAKGNKTHWGMTSEAFIRWAHLTPLLF